MTVEVRINRRPPHRTRIDAADRATLRTTLAKWMGSQSALWQRDLLEPAKFSRFLEDRGIGAFSAEHLIGLWRLGLLRADLVSSSKALPEPFKEIKNEGGERLYTDLRVPERRPTGWAGALSTPTQEPSSPLFHPFRLIVVDHLRRLFRFGLHPLQYLIDPDGGARLEAMYRQRFASLTNDPAFLDQLEEITLMADLAILVEPYASPKMTDHIRGWTVLDDHAEVLGRYWTDARALLVAVSLDDLEQVRSELVFRADRLDGNTVVHTLIRFMNASSRERLKGPLAGAVLVKAAAEGLRRGAEDAFGKQLPEEEALIHGPMIEDINRNRYGAARVLDGDAAVQDTFMREHGLAFATRVRWYVEGETEHAALQKVLGQFGHIDLVRMNGKDWLEGKPTGQGCREALCADQRNRVFSFLAFDGDVGKLTSTFKLAIQANELCGVVCVSESSEGRDFELANFTRDELVAGLLELARRRGTSLENDDALHQAVNSVQSGKKLMTVANKLRKAGPELTKGRAWGQVLSELLLDSPLWASSTIEGQDARPFLPAIRDAVWTMSGDYQWQVDNQPLTVYGTGPVADQVRNLARLTKADH